MDLSIFNIIKHKSYTNWSRQFIVPHYSQKTSLKFEIHKVVGFDQMLFSSFNLHRSLLVYRAIHCNLWLSGKWNKISED